MSCFLWALAGTQFLFLMTSLGAALVFLGRDGENARAQELLLGFAGGVMSAAAVWSLLLPAIEQAEAAGLPGWLPAAAGLLSGAVFLALLDRLQSGAAGRERMLFTAITLHNIPEGMAVGLAFALASGGEGRAAACALALGVGIQNFPEGAAVALPLRQLGMGRGRAFLLGALSGAVEPVFGLLAFLLAAPARPVMPWLLSFSAGAMLYVTVHELCPAARSGAGSFGYLGGFALMMALDVALG
ncbi:MAG: ZIP family metal transporter [Oscillospiraceae bacterium]|nr:ZIP family metal transporter [Oscillospiraceae bacterium]